MRRVSFLIASVAMVASIVVAGIAGGSESGDNLYRDLSLFTEVVDLVERSYVDEVDPADLVEGAFSGLAEAVDEYSYYISPGSMDEYRIYEQNRESEGIGLTVSKRLGYAYIVSVVDGSPADEAGIEAGDFIERIDGALTSDMPVWRIDAATRFIFGDSLELTIVRAGMSERDQHEFTNEDWESDPVALRWDEKTAIVDLGRLSADTPQLVAAIIEDVTEEGAEGMILDLRGVAGGPLEAAVELADMFLDDGVIATLEGRRIDQERWNAESGAIWNDKLVVLIDATTAGPAELLAGALSRNGRAETVGFDTYGMSSQQRLVELESGGAIYVTVGHYRAGESESPTVEPDVRLNRADYLLLSDDDDRDLIMERGLATIRS